MLLYQKNYWLFPQGNYILGNQSTFVRFYCKKKVCLYGCYLIFKSILFSWLNQENKSNLSHLIPLRSTSWTYGWVSQGIGLLNQHTRKLYYGSESSGTEMKWAGFTCPYIFLFDLLGPSSPRHTFKVYKVYIQQEPWFLVQGYFIFTTSMKRHFWALACIGARVFWARELDQLIWYSKHPMVLPKLLRRAQRSR